MIRVQGITDVGLVRKENQDAYAVREEMASGHTVCVVCDGMGGAAGGKLASRIAVTTYLEELEKVPEVGRSTAVLIALVPALYRKALISAASERAVILDTTQRCGDYFRALFAAQAREVFYQACLDGKGKLLNLYRISEGDVSSVTLNIRTIAENAIRANAVQVVLAHNHPSGIALPSEDDVNTTEQARKALGTVGVRLADHIIVADGDFVSMAESGYLERI